MSLAPESAGVASDAAARSSGVVVYRGPSRLDGSPIFVGITLDSLNAKTGDMAQAWIMRADLDPMKAIAGGLDSSICGSCVHRSGGTLGRSCYVVPWFAPLNVWKQFSVGAYRPVSPAEASRILAGRNVRISAYGDPAAAPFETWRELLIHVSGWTGYTHQWRTCDQRFARICMASVESPAEAAAARALGWRTFRVRTWREAPDDATEIVCPASEEAGHRLTCSECRLCVGTNRRDARSVVIRAHGQRTSHFNSAKERS